MRYHQLLLLVIFLFFIFCSLILILKVKVNINIIDRCQLCMDIYFYFDSIALHIFIALGATNFIGIARVTMIEVIH